MAQNRKPLDLPPVEPEEMLEFIARWRGSDGAERANYQLFLFELCTALRLPTPDPASSDNELNIETNEKLENSIQIYELGQTSPQQVNLKQINQSASRE
jgi:hypothetical protein